MITRNFEISNQNVTIQHLTGVENRHFEALEKHYDINLIPHGNSIALTGDDKNVNNALNFLQLACTIMERYHHLELHDYPYLYDIVDKNLHHRFVDALDEILTRNYNGKPIRAKTLGQKQLIDAMKHGDMTFAIGPAGTGKTYLAVAFAAEQLKKNVIQKIILTRPAVEAGENLGFLPGDLKEKVDPYLRPLYDALDDMFSSERTQRYIEKGVIEIAPLAYMRGRTLDDAVIILDEAQNTTKAQMMMFLSRLGRNSKMIITGDIDQIDLPRNQASGLKIAAEYLADIDEISFVSLSHSDVVRHPLVIKILKKFAEGDQKNDKDTYHRR